MIPVAIIGGAGYTGGELIRILLNHPFVELSAVVSESQAGKLVSSIHTDLVQLQTSDTMFGGIFREKRGFSSMDYRLADPSHDFVYGLPELNREKIRISRHIANCGCFATAIQLALLPLAEAKLLNHEIHVNAITGSTGAGQALSDTVHYSWRTNNISVYKPFTHQHVPEIRQSLSQLYPDFVAPIHFMPVRGNFTRGIFATVYFTVDISITEAKDLFTQYYIEEPFVKLTDENPDLKQVVNTNKCLLHLEKHQDKLLIISALDNLLKGASGQAVQNMNIMYGWPEESGLKLKGVVY